MLAVAALMITGCTGGSSGGVATGGADGEASAEGARAGDAAARGMEPGGAKSGAPAKKRANLPDLGRQDRKVIYTATLKIRAEDVSSAVSQAKRIVRRADGYVHGQHVTTSSGSSADGGTQATLTLKIPPTDFSRTLDRLSGIGTLLERRQNAKDVTEKVADVQSRIASAKATIKRLRTLLERADTVEDVLKVEEQLAQREADLESLQARADALAEKTSYGTVTLRLHGPRQPAVSGPSGPPGFVSGLFAGWGAFTTFWSGLLTALGATLPFLVLSALLAAAGWRLRGYLRWRRAP